MTNRTECKNGKKHEWKKSTFKEDGIEFEYDYCEKCGYWT